jgi:hypothetical protein
MLPFPRTNTSHGFSDGYAEHGEAVQDGHTNLELRNLTVEVPRLEAPTQGFRVTDLRVTQSIFVSTLLRR